MATQIGGYTPPPIAGSSGATPAPADAPIVRYTTPLDGNTQGDEYYSRFTINAGSASTTPAATPSASVPTPAPTPTASATPTPSASPAPTATASYTPTATSTYAPVPTPTGSTYSYQPQRNYAGPRGERAYTPPVMPYVNRQIQTPYAGQQPPVKQYDPPAMVPDVAPPPVKVVKPVVQDYQRPDTPVYVNDQPPVTPEHQKPEKPVIVNEQQPVVQPVKPQGSKHSHPSELLAVGPDGNLYNNNPQEGPMPMITDPTMPVIQTVLGNAGNLVPSNVSSSLLSPEQIAALSSPIPTTPIPTSSGHGSGSGSGGGGNNWTQDLYGGILNNYFGGQEPSTNGITDTAGLQFTSGY